MAQTKKTSEELELAAHNRLKGTISYHIASAQSQLACVKRKLIEYNNTGCDMKEKNEVYALITTLTHLERATTLFKETTYHKLAIGHSPTSPHNARPLRKRKPYAT